MLNWTGKRTPAPPEPRPALRREAHGPGDGWRDRLYLGDNLLVLGHLLPALRGQVDLIYIDPPFDSRAEYKKRIAPRGPGGAGNAGAFDQPQYSDVWSEGEYLQFMYERVNLLRELLSERGALYLHCDWRRAPYLRCLCDEVFGIGCFINEIVWRRSANTSSIGRIWKRAHDTLLFYARTRAYTFNSQYRPLSAASRKLYTTRDERGAYRLVPLLVSGRRKGRTGEAWRGIDPNLRGRAGMHWVTTPDRLERYFQEGRVVFPDREGGAPNLKYYLRDNKGVAVSDLWDDISLIPSAGKESHGYPTQKPEALLERVVRASSNQGDLVLDCFMGSGTTAAVARRLGRRFIGADINPAAVETTTQRLLRGPLPGAGFDVYHVGEPPAAEGPAPRARIAVRQGALVVEAFHAGDLARRLGLPEDEGAAWQRLVQSVMIDWHHDGAVFAPTTIDIASGDRLVRGAYQVPPDAGAICVKITDLLSRSLEVGLA